MLPHPQTLGEWDFIYLTLLINYEIIGTNSINTSDGESLFIKLSNLTSKHFTTIGVIYRYSKNNIAHFTDKLSKTLDSYLNQPHDLALMGDFNINLDPEKRQTEAWHYLETLLGFGLFHVITKPTRVTATSQTLIDHIFTTITAQTVTLGIYQYEILTTFLYSVKSITTHQNIKHLINEGFTEIMQLSVKHYLKKT